MHSDCRRTARRHTQQNLWPEVQFSGQLRKSFATNQIRSESTQTALAGLRLAIINSVRNGETQNRIAEKLKPFVIA